ncbi:MAG: glycosyltransferase, partial [Duncaniella sp.]|nr:glycosyltransferase [Duncaniella sp.]
SKIATAMMDDGVDAVFGDIHFVDDGNLHKCVRYYSSRYFHRWMMKMGYQPAHPSFYCRKSCYDRYGAFDIDFRVAADFEHMFRLIYVNRIKTRYLTIDFVTMRTGGASTSGISSHRRILADHLRTYRKHGVGSGYALDFIRYPFKISEIIYSKIFHRQNIDKNNENAMSQKA